MGPISSSDPPVGALSNPSNGKECYSVRATLREAPIASTHKVPLSQLSPARSGRNRDNDNCEGGTGVIDVSTRP